MLVLLYTFIFMLSTLI